MMPSLKKVLLSATLAPAVYSLALAPRQITIETPSTTIVPGLADEVASGAEEVETEVPEPVQGPECTQKPFRLALDIGIRVIHQES